MDETFGRRRGLRHPLQVDAGLGGVVAVHTGAYLLAVPLEHASFLVEALGAVLLVDRSDRMEASPMTGEWGGRGVVQQATVMVMAQVRVAPLDALALLRRHPCALGVDLDDVARRVVQRRISFADFDVEGD